MKDGFISVAVGVPEVHIADCKYNAQRICELIDSACEKGASILALPELCVTGYTCGDLFLQDLLLKESEKAVSEIAKYSKDKDLMIFLGAPVACNGKLYNCCVVILNGEILGAVPKTFIPNYSEFYEQRYFSAADDEVQTVEIGCKDVILYKRQLFRHRAVPELVIGAEICEDLWTVCPPSTEHCQNGATVIINISASPENIGKCEYRRELVKSQSARCICAYLYANAGVDESTTDVVYSGNSLVAQNGIVSGEIKPFSNERLLVTQIDVSRLVYERRRMTTFDARCDESYIYQPFYFAVKATSFTAKIDAHPFVPSDKSDRDERCNSILTMQAYGLRKRILHTKSEKVVIGVSGGLDSTLALLVCAKTFDIIGKSRKDIVAVTMPCFGTTHRTKSNAEKLCEILGVTLKCIDISAAVRKHFEDICHDESVKNTVYENSQARERTQVLMDIANEAGGIVVGTGDLSEIALGWSTYNADHISMYNVNCSVPKTLVSYIIGYYAETSDIGELSEVLYDILDTPVSPELLPAVDGEIQQKTQDIIGSYELHDFILYYSVRCGCPPQKVYRLAKNAFGGVFDDGYIKKCMATFYKRFFTQQFKRSCFADGVKVGSVSLSPRGDWRMPSDACCRMWLDEVEKL